MGNGDQRPMDCVSPECSNGPAEKQKLLGPKSITASPDGALYVADYNIIRKISPDSTVKTVGQLTMILGHLDSPVRYSVNSISDPIRRCNNVLSIHQGNYPRNN